MGSGIARLQYHFPLAKAQALNIQGWQMPMGRGLALEQASSRYWVCVGQGQFAPTHHSLQPADK